MAKVEIKTFFLTESIFLIVDNHFSIAYINLILNINLTHYITQTNNRLYKAHFPVSLQFS